MIRPNLEATAEDQPLSGAPLECFRIRLTQLAACRLQARFRRLIDPEDIVQSVFRTFYRRYGQPSANLAEFDDLWPLLARITVRKCGQKSKELRCQKRDVDRQESLSTRADERVLREQVSAAQQAEANDLLDWILDQLDELEAEVVLLKLLDFRVSEISARVHRTERTVFRILNALRSRFQDLLQIDG